MARVTGSRTISSNFIEEFMARTRSGTWKAERRKEIIKLMGNTRVCSFSLLLSAVVEPIVDATFPPGVRAQRHIQNMFRVANFSLYVRARQ
jgi:hypothetical protein